MFALLGLDENAASRALGWTLSRSPALASALLSRLGLPSAGSELRVSLQRYGERDGGFTDIEISAGDALHVVVEAKKGWVLPGEAQLRRYVGRLGQCRGDRMLVSLSAADPSFAARRLPGAIDGVPVRHLAWHEVRADVRQALRRTSSGRERVWLEELDQHLEDYVAAETTNSNMVYVVSLSRGEIEPGYTWIDVVERDDRYFHPYASGGGWPLVAPNYLGFRYDGRLQSVRHVDSHLITDDLGSVNPMWSGVDGEHVVYGLGPPMRPAGEVRTGNLFRAARVQCAIDTLLSGACDTIAAARDETARRTSVR